MTRPTPATYQIEGARFLLSRQKAILGDDIGLGKTYTAILAADQVPGEKLIVCPKSLISQWVEQLQVFSANPGLYTVCNYESLKKYAYARTVIFDEATYIKSPKAQRTVTALEYALEADFVFFLTATPVRNHMPDFFTMFYVIFPDLKRSNTGHLPTDLYRSYKKWLYENFDIFYHEIDGKVIEKVKSLNPGAERVIGPMIAHALLKRSKSMLNLPPLTQEIVAVSWAPGQRQAYEAVLRNVLEMSDGEAQKIDHMLARMTRLRQAALDPSLFGGVEASGKTAWLKEVIPQIGLPTLVFTNYAEYARRIASQIKGAVVFDGSMSDVQRERAKEAFMRESADVLVLSAQAGGFGLNLQRAQLVVWTDLPWTPDVWEQGTGRAWRRGQENPVHEVVLGHPDSIDGRVLRLLRKKEKVASEAYAMREVWRMMKEDGEE